MTMIEYKNLNMRTAMISAALILGFHARAAFGQG